MHKQVLYILLRLIFIIIMSTSTYNNNATVKEDDGPPIDSVPSANNSNIKIRKPGDVSTTAAIGQTEDYLTAAAATAKDSADFFNPKDSTGDANDYDDESNSMDTSISNETDTEIIADETATIDTASIPKEYVSENMSEETATTLEEAASSDTEPIERFEVITSTTSANTKAGRKYLG
jgi:hypothetical protein